MKCFVKFAKWEAVSVWRFECTKAAGTSAGQQGAAMRPHSATTPQPCHVLSCLLSEIALDSGQAQASHRTETSNPLKHRERKQQSSFCKYDLLGFLVGKCQNKHSLASFSHIRKTLLQIFENKKRQTAYLNTDPCVGIHCQCWPSWLSRKTKSSENSGNSMVLGVCCLV